MSITWPASPNVGDTYTEGTAQFVYDGTGWTNRRTLVLGKQFELTGSGTNQLKLVLNGTDSNTITVTGDESTADFSGDFTNTNFAVNASSFAIWGENNVCYVVSMKDAAANIQMQVVSGTYTVEEDDISSGGYTS